MVKKDSRGSQVVDYLRQKIISSEGSERSKNSKFWTYFHRLQVTHALFLIRTSKTNGKVVGFLQVCPPPNTRRKQWQLKLQNTLPFTGCATYNFEDTYGT